jgi:RNA polymerase sigma-70 factor (ECF subfamily)
METMTQHADQDQALDEQVRRVKTDRAVFAALYDRHYPRILKYCSRRLYSQSVGEDLTGDVFLIAATKIDTFRGRTDGEFSQWLYTIATNKINEHVRNYERRKELLEMAAKTHRIGSSPTVDTKDHLDWPVVYEAILQLKPRDQTLITLRYMQELPHEQIAGIVNLKPAAVRVALSRAMAQLRERFNTDQPNKKGARQ